MAYIIFWSRPVTRAILRRRLEEYHEEHEDDDTGETLIENVENFRIGGRLVHFDLVYDRIIPTMYRGESSHYIRDERVSVTVYENEEADICVYITEGNKYIMNKAMGSVSEIIFDDEGIIKKLPITRDVLKNVVTNDNIEISVAWMKDVDQYMDTAAMLGSLRDSPDFQRFWRSSNSAYAVYTSTYLNKPVGISVKNSSIVYLDEGNTINYLDAILIPELEF